MPAHSTQERTPGRMPGLEGGWFGWQLRWSSRLPAGDTADWQSALPGRAGRFPEIGITPELESGQSRHITIIGVRRGAAKGAARSGDRAYRLAGRKGWFFCHRRSAETPLRSEWFFSRGRGSSPACLTTHHMMLHYSGSSDLPVRVPMAYAIRKFCDIV